MDKQTEDPPIKDQSGFIRKDWKFERLGWIGMALLILAALTGLFGKGGLIWNKSVAGSPKAGVEVEYNEFWRVGSPEKLKMTISGADTVLVVQSRHLHHLKIENLLPHPVNSDILADRFTLRFRPAAGIRTILVYFTPAKAGTFQASVKAGNNQPVNFSVFIYP